MNDMLINKRPYPGLRSFRRDEAAIFFGREHQTSQLLGKLSDSRFISVVGQTGCGKSSLIRAGMLAELANGHAAKTGINWCIAEMRPSADPLRSLAESLLADSALGAEGTKILKKRSRKKKSRHPLDPLAPLLDILHRNPRGLIEVLRETALPAETNVLLVVDQFEELFLHRRRAEHAEEIETFVRLLLESARQDETPIRVVTTMRSEYVGKCAVFDGLSEAMQSGQFFVPPLGREQQEQAIVEPARVCGGSIAPELVNLMLHEMEQGVYQLPLLQHCLMRMWSQEGTPLEGDVAITMADYERVGGLQQALSRHADEAFGELNDAQQAVVERLFRCLSTHDSGGQALRYPMLLKDIAAVARTSEPEVKAVIEVFRRPDRCFLTPPAGTELAAETMIDINHESLIRHWQKLHSWVAQEADSASLYQRLETTARLWKEGQAAVWGDPDLKIALDWKRTDHPVAEWAQRYGDHFELAMEFLEASIQNKIEEDVEHRRVRELERNYKELADEYRIQQEIEREHELQLLDLRARQRELDLKHEREMKLKNKRLRETTQRVFVWSLVIAAVIITISAKWTFLGTLNAQKEKSQAVLAANEAQQAQQSAEERNSTYEAMVAAMLRFISETDQNKPFFRWVQETSEMETLLPGLQMMIETSPGINDEEKAHWKNKLASLSEEKQLELLRILSGIAGNVNGSVQILETIVKNTENAIIHPWDGTYLLKPGEKIIIEMEINHPSEQNVKIEYSNIGKDSILSNPKGNDSGIAVTYVASRLAGSRDVVMIKVVDQDKGKILEQMIVTIKVIESASPIELE